MTDPLYIDEVIFDQGDNEQEIKLITLVQDAYFLFPQRDADGIKEKIVWGIDEEGEEIHPDFPEKCFFARAKNTANEYEINMKKIFILHLN